MTKTAAPAQGWGISLLFRGRNVGERSVRDGDPLLLGEDPACTFVVPGLGARVPLVQADRLLHVPGLTATVHRDGAPPEPCEAATLAPGERAELRLAEHPEIALELRRQTFERLPLATLVNVRELGRQLALGAGLVAGMVLLVRSEKPVNTLEIKGEPDAPADSLLVRAMFAAAIEPPPPTIDLRILPPPVLVLPEPILPSRILEAAPPPIAAPTEHAPPRIGTRDSDSDEMAYFANALTGTEVDAIVSDDRALLGVLGGVEGGVLDSKQTLDVLAERRDDAPGLAIGGGGQGEGVSAIGSILGPGDDEFVVGGVGLGVVGGRVELADALEDAPVEKIVEAPVDDSFVELPMGPGAADPIPEPDPEAPPPTSTGPNSHDEHGTVAVLRGSMNGLAAVAPETACEDPTLVKKRQLDVVFVVDVSTTMGFLLDRLGKQIDQVDREARAHGLDTRYGLVVFVDDVLLANNGQAFADLPAMQAELARWRAFTANNRQVHSPASNFDWPENSLDALHIAATGFAWRPTDATLRMIVHATDDDFGEAPAVQSGQTVQHSYLEVAAALRAAEVRMFSFAAKVGGQCECLDVRAGLFTRHRGRASLPDATGGAVFDIDEVASGKLGLAAAVSGAIKSGVCTRYPLSPFAAAPVAPAATTPAPAPTPEQR